MVAAFVAIGVEAVPVVYSDDAVARVRSKLLELDGVLVWVNPIEQGLDRSQLDPLLRDVADAGVFVSAHPDVILRLGTKQVLVDTRALSWGTETYAHRSVEAFRARLLSLEGPRVFKQHRGMGGDGVWKVERVAADVVDVQHAAARDGSSERLSVDDFVARCAPYFTGDGRMIEQPFLPRLAEGMTRVYLTHDRVVGFALQFPRGLLPPADSVAPAKTFLEPDEPRFAELRAQMEDEWLPELRRVLSLDVAQLPVIWDADFVRGDDGAYVLLEINCSSTFAFPEFAMPGVARATVELLE
jgi:hypothetical protein